MFRFRRFYYVVMCFSLVISYFFGGVIVYADEPHVRDAFSLLPNPYKLMSNIIKDKVKYEEQTLGAVIRYLRFNCVYPNSHFCYDLQIFENIEYYERKISQSKTSGSLIWGDEIYVLSSLYSGNFEADFLISEEEVKAENNWIVEYIKDRARLSEGVEQFSQNFFKVNNLNSATVIPLYYAASTSASSFEMLIKYLAVADCDSRQVLCNYLLSTMSEDYERILSVYNEKIIFPLDKIQDFVFSGERSNFNFTEEQVWIQEANRSLTSLDYSFLFDKLLASAGYINDTEHIFKLTYVKTYQIKNNFLKFNEIIRKKAIEWKENSSSLVARSKITKSETPFRQDFLFYFMREIEGHKRIIIDQIQQLDREVENERLQF